MIEAYSVRWQIELFFKELKSTLGAFASTSSRNSLAVEALDQLRDNDGPVFGTTASETSSAGSSPERGTSTVGGSVSGLHGLCEAFRQECTAAMN